MSERVSMFKTTWTDICDAVRERTYSSGELVAGDVAEAIRSLPSAVIPYNLPNDGRTRLCYTVPGGQDQSQQAKLVYYNVTASTVTIDWGDGTIGTSSGAVSSYTSRSHNYTAAGDYIITITVTSGSIRFGGTASNTIYGNATGAEAYQRGRIKWAVIGNNETIGSYAFYYCVGLKEVRLPSSGITSLGTNAFQYCTSLTTINLPSTITSIGSNCFAACYNLDKVDIPSGVTAVTSNVLQNCYALRYIVIPATVTSVAASAFSNCYGLGYIWFKSATPPTVANSNAFNNLPARCKIYVPTGKKSTYQGTANYPDSNTYTYVETSST